MNRMIHFACSRRRQRGASLIVALVMLAILMILGIAAFVASTTQFRMAGNLQFQNAAAGNAESALALAETWLVPNYGNTGFTTRTSGGLYPFGVLTADPLTMTWDDTNSEKVDGLGTQRYTIELIGTRTLPANSLSPSACGYAGNAPCPKVNVYRLTARGTSILGTVKIVQSVFAVRVNIV